MASTDSVELYQPRSRGRGQRRLDLKRDEIFLESLDRFLGQSVPIDPAFIAPFIRGRVEFPHSSEPYKRSTTIVIVVENGFLETVMIAATTFDFRIMGADTPCHRRARHRKNSIKRGSRNAVLFAKKALRYRSRDRNCCTFPPTDSFQ